MLLLSNCQNKRKYIDTSGNITPKVEKKITVYGSENCEHCQAFRKKMDSLNLKYLFKDAEANENYYSELVLKIQQTGQQVHISFPVVEVDDKLYTRPDFDKFLDLIDQ